jgi:hypothetical protein
MCKHFPSQFQEIEYFNLKALNIIKSNGNYIYHLF